MKEIMINIFNDYAGIIVFLHVMSAVVWIGGMISLRFAVHFSMQNIDDSEIKLGTILEYLKRFFSIVIPAIIFLIITAGLMAIGLGFKGTPLYPIVHAKEGIWTVMLILFILINMKRNKAQKYFDNKDFKSAKSFLIPIASWMIPLNIILGIIAIYLGITLRGF